MASSQTSKKQLKAIVFTDIADFTKLSAQDEQRALDLIQHQNASIRPIVESYDGKWLKEIGDSGGACVKTADYFPSVLRIATSLFVCPPRAPQERLGIT